MTNTAKEYYSLVEIKMRWPWRKRSPPWNPRRSNLAPKHLGVRAQSGPTGLAAPVGPVRRGGTPTSRRTGIPRHPDPPGRFPSALATIGASGYGHPWSLMLRDALRIRVLVWKPTSP